MASRKTCATEISCPVVEFAFHFIVIPDTTIVLRQLRWIFLEKCYAFRLSARALREESRNAIMQNRKNIPSISSGLNAEIWRDKNRMKEYTKSIGFRWEISTYII